MDATTIGQLIASVGPGTAIGVLGVWFGFKKDAQCTALMERLIGILDKQSQSNNAVVSSIDGLREAIRLGTEVK